MRRLVPHEQLIILPALCALIESLRGDAALAAELDEKFATSGELPLGWELSKPDEKNPEQPGGQLVWCKEEREAIELICELHAETTFSLREIASELQERVGSFRGLSSWPVEIIKELITQLAPRKEGSKRKAKPRKKGSKRRVKKAKPEVPYFCGCVPLRAFDPRVQQVFREVDEALRKYGGETEADEILRLYKDAPVGAVQEYVEALLADLKSGETLLIESRNADLLDGDGPLEPGSFIWKSKEHDGLPRIPFKLLSALWQAKFWRREIDSALGKEVWEDDTIKPDVDMAGAARTTLNNFFGKEIPLRVRKKGKFLLLEKEASKEES